MRVLVEGNVDRAILMFGADADPDAELTWARGVTLLASGDESSTVLPGLPDPIAVVGFSHAGLDALAFAAFHRSSVDRLVLVSTPIPEDEGALRFDPSAITAKTLLLFGAKDPLTGSRHGAWWQRRLPAARLEMSPEGGHDLLGSVWKRALSHAAPHCRR